jgi:serine/threonine protein kinase
MAELYTARAVHPDGSTRHVVLKRILPHLAQDPEFIKMFRDEAQLAATLVHDNIVRVHEIGRDTDDYFFTMEYVHGENCRTIIRAAQEAEAHVPLEHIVQIGLGVTEGLHYAHEHTDAEGTWLQVVHRDVSPTNIIVAFDGEVKIVDFGIAKAAAASHITQAGMLKGKASYMAPEQCRAETVDRRTDVYAIGILLYEMTTLTRLFRGDNELAILHQILTGNFDRPSQRIAGYPADLEAIVVKCLSSAPDDRYQNTIEIRDELRRFAANNGLHPSAAGLGAYLLDLCGDKAYPWADEDDEEAAEPESETTTTGQTSSGFDEQDTKVNRSAEPKTPPPRPLTPTPAPAVAATTPRSPTDKHRPVESRSPRIKPAPRPGGATSSLGRPVAPGPAKPPGTTTPRRRSAAPTGSVPVATSRPPTRDDKRPERPRKSTSSPGGIAARVAALGKPSAPPLIPPARPRGPGRAARPGPLTARQTSGAAPPGVTLPGLDTPKSATLSGSPQPSQSRLTIPGGSTARTQAPAAGSAPSSTPTMPATERPPSPPQLSQPPIGSTAPPPGQTAPPPGRTAPPSPRATAVPSAPPPPSATVPAPASTDLRQRPTVHPLTPPPAAVDRTMIMTSAEEAKVRETILSQTMHLDPVVGGAPAATAPIPSGPMQWGTDASSSPSLLVTQQSTSGPHAASPSHGSSGSHLASPAPSSPSSSDHLMHTQRAVHSGAGDLLATQRAIYAGADASASMAEDPARRRMPVWIPIVIILVVAAATAAAVLALWPTATSPDADEGGNESAQTQPRPASSASDDAVPAATAKVPAGSATPASPTAEPEAPPPVDAQTGDAGSTGAADSTEADAPAATPPAKDPPTKTPTAKPPAANPRPSRPAEPKPKKTGPTPSPSLPGITPGRPVPP